MRILHAVESYLPAVSGMAEVVRQLSERMVARGHEVVVATGSLPERENKEIAGVKVVEFAVTGNRVRGVTGDVRAYLDFLCNSRFEIVTGFAAQQWATDLMLDVLKDVSGKKVFVPTGFSALNDPLYSSYFQQMPEWMRQFDMNVLNGWGYRDARFAKNHGITNCMMIPNGAAAEEFMAEHFCDLRKKIGIPPHHILILHVGAHTWLKGHQEAMEIFARSGIRDATFLIVGDGEGGCLKECRKRAERLNRSGSFLKCGKRIRLAQLSREETVAAFREADLFLFPSSIESSPIVLFECMASKTPFLVTDVGNAREIADWSGGGVILPTTVNEDMEGKRHFILTRFKRFLGIGEKQTSPLDCYVRARVRPSAALLTDICRNPEFRQQLADSGFAAWQQRFRWETITDQYEDLYIRLADRKLS